MVQTKDRLNLFTRTWDVDDAKANIYIVHGIAEHSGRYNGIADFFNERNCSAHSFDLRGHGKSEGDPIFISKFQDMADDMEIWMNSVFNSSKPSFLFAHSLGALVCAYYLLYKKPKLKGLVGVMYTAPAFMISKDLAPILQKLAPIIGTIFPKMKTVGLDGKYISKDQAVVKAYQEDPLVYHKKSHAKTGWEIMKAMKWVQSKASEFSYPLYLGHGTEDKLTELEGSKVFIENIKSTDKTFKIYEGLYHELFNEPEKEIFYKDLDNWFMARL